jgi:carboxymethylenebutenolidase
LIERELVIRTTSGPMETFLVHPEGRGPFPVVLFLMDAGGRRDELDGMARRLSSDGYFVVMPDLYYRRAAAGLEPGRRSTMVANMNALSNALACEDLLATLEWLPGQPLARPGAVGIVGYCMSGPFAFAAAAAFPDRVAAAASFHGVRLATEALDSPHRDAARISGELYFGCAEHDEWAPAAMIERLAEALAAAGVPHRIEWYPGTHHGFVFPGRPAYQPDSAERHWERLLDLFERTLGG